MKVTHFSYSLKMLYNLISHCDGSVNIQGNIFVSAVFLFSVYFRQFSLGLPINSYVPLFFSWLFLFITNSNLEVWAWKYDPWAKLILELQNTFLWLAHWVHSGFCHSRLVNLQRDQFIKTHSGSWMAGWDIFKDPLKIC